MKEEVANKADMSEAFRLSAETKKSPGSRYKYKARYENVDNKEGKKYFSGLPSQISLSLSLSLLKPRLQLRELPGHSMSRGSSSRPGN